MIGFWDIDPYFESLGFKKIEERPYFRFEKPKIQQTENGEPQQFIEEELDPLAEQFRAEVRDSRPALARLELDHPALRGETFDMTHAVDAGLIDGIVVKTNEALSEAHELGSKWNESRKQQRNRVLSLI